MRCFTLPTGEVGTAETFGTVMSTAGGDGGCNRNVSGVHGVNPLVTTVRKRRVVVIGPVPVKV